MLAKMANDTSYALNYDHGRLHKKAIAGLSSLNFDLDLEGEEANFDVHTGLKVLFPHEVYESSQSHLAHRLLAYKSV